MKEKAANKLCNEVRGLEKGDILYDTFNYKSVKIKNKQHALDLAEDMKHNFSLYSRIRYEIFDPSLHLRLNKKRKDNYISKWL